jgi:hypothetical protein
MMQNQIMQRVIPSYEDEDMLLYQFVNVPRTWQYYASLNAPVTFNKWWTGSFNLTAGDLQQQIDAAGPTRRKLFGVLSANMSFSLPADFNIEVGGYAMSRIMNANIESLPMYNMNIGLKKGFADNKFTASLGVNNIFNIKQRVYSYGSGFGQWTNVMNNGTMTAYISFRYNFSAGAKFRARQIEKGSAEDTQRIGGGQQ